jgi:hypothetical protein
LPKHKIIMKKTIHIILFFLSTQVTLAQSQGKYSVGIGLNNGIGTYGGFRPNMEINFGRFYGKNLEIGLKMGGFVKKTDLQTFIVNNQSYDEFIEKSFQANIYGRYYISNYRLRPFVLGEIGFETSSSIYYAHVSSSGIRGMGNSSTNMTTRLGAGFSYALTKKRNLFIDASLAKNVLPNLTNNGNPNSGGQVNTSLRYIFGKK